AHAAAAMHRDPFARPHPRLIDHRAEGGGETAAEARGGGEIQFFGQMNEIGVSVMDADIFGEGPPIGEAGLLLVRADLMVARMALRATAAARDEGHGDAL